MSQLLEIRFFTLSCFLLLALAGFSQQNEEITISANYDNVLISDIFNELKEKNNLTFSYPDNWDASARFTGSFNNIPLKKVLEQILAATPATFVIIQNNVVLLPRDKVAYIIGDMVNQHEADDSEQSQVVIGNPDLIGKYNSVKFTGVVRDGATGDPLTGANVIVENTNKNTVCGYDGDFQLTMSPGTYSITVSSIGFESKKVDVELISPGKLEVELFEKTLEINELIVYAQKADANVRSYQMSVVELDAKSIKLLPALVGEKDIIKSMTMMPGVKSVGEFGSGINVRGGGEDQNLYLIEETPVFNTSHVMGLLSVVNPDMVNDVTLYKGHIPARYGERVSSVMDIGIKDHNLDEFHARGGIGLYNSRLMFEGPLLNKHITYKIGGRTSYSDFLLTKMPDYYLKNSSATFYDITGDVHIALKNNPISIFGYYSNDYFKYANEFYYDYGNMMGSLDWKHVFNSEFSSSLSFAYSEYGITKEQYGTDSKGAATDYHLQSGIEYGTGKLRFNFTAINNHKLELGAQAIAYHIEPGVRNSINGSVAEPKNMDDENGVEYAFYVNDIYEPAQYLTFQFGLRYSVYNFLGNTTLSEYKPGSENIVSDFNNVEPRASVKLQLSPKSSLKLSYNRNVQYINLLSYTSISTPEDIWKLSDPNLKPVVADQLAVGYFRNFYDNKVETSIELYYKNLNNLFEYKDGAELSMSDDLELYMLNAHGRNYGVELFIKKSAGDFDGWISYTYSRSLKQTNGSSNENAINRNEIYPSQFDKPHDLSVYLNYHVNRRFRMGVNFSYASGRSITLPESTYKWGSYELVKYSDRNEHRLTDYHRLDISISMDENLKIKKAWKGSWTFSVLNVYARKNAYSISYRSEVPSVNNNFEQYSLSKLYLIGIPLPTLTYNFIF